MALALLLVLNNIILVRIPGYSIPMYSLDVPLKGMRVDTTDTYTPTLSFLGSIRYELQFTRFMATYRCIGV
jgi:hypothetical protein